MARTLETEKSLRGGRKVSGAANQPWHMLGNGIENLAGGIAAGSAGFFRFASFGVFNIAPWEGGDFLVPALGKIAIEHLLDVERLGGELGFVIREQFVPSLACGCAFFAHAVFKGRINLGRNMEFGLGVGAIKRLGGFDGVPTERLAVRGVVILLAGNTPSDMAIRHNKRGPVFGFFSLLQHVKKTWQIVDISYAQDVPPVGQEAGAHIFVECQIGFTFNGDPVAVVYPAEVVQLKVACKAGSFAGDTFHHATVAANGINAEVEKVEPGLVVAGSQPLSCNGHTNACGNAIAQWTGGGFNARTEMIFRVAGANAA